MLKLTLIRLETSDHGTFGLLSIPNGEWLETFYVGELPWRNNASNVSCIPKGTYKCLWTYSPRFKKNMYLVDGVKDRAGIRMHSANFMGDDTKGYKRQLNGCIALGEKLGVMEGQKVILVSSPAMRRFEKIMAGRPFELEIR